MADLLTYIYPSGTKEFMPIAKNNAAEHNSVFRGEEIPYTWAELKTKVTNGDFSNLYIGDYKQITLSTNEVVICEIAGINNYKGWGSTAIGNHIDFISRDCLATAYQFNTTAANNGTSDRETPWAASALFQTLNNPTTGVVSTLPSDLQNVLIVKLGWLERRYSAGGPVSNDTSATWGGDKLWIPAEVEVFDHPTWSEIGYGTAGFQQYPIFRLNPAKIIKGAGNGGSRCFWWELSALRMNDTSFCCAASDGRAGYTGASTAIGVPLCFRVA